jgi:hypothetical protein
MKTSGKRTQRGSGRAGCLRNLNLKFPRTASAQLSCVGFRKWLNRSHCVMGRKNVHCAGNVFPGAYSPDDPRYFLAAQPTFNSSMR